MIYFFKDSKSQLRVNKFQMIYYAFCFFKRDCFILYSMESPNRDIVSIIWWIKVMTLYQRPFLFLIFLQHFFFKMLLFHFIHTYITWFQAVVWSGYYHFYLFNKLLMTFDIIKRSALVLFDELLNVPIMYDSVFGW